MKRKFAILFPIAAACFSLASCDFITVTKIDPEGGKEEQETPVEVDKDALNEFYKDYDLTKSGGKLLNELQKMSFAKHTYWVTYGEVNKNYTNENTIKQSVEAIAAGSSKNQYFYTGKSASGYGTREHVWPCANSAQLWFHQSTAPTSFTPHYVDWSYYTGGGSDLFHVRTCGSAVNSARGNSKFVSFSDPEQATYASGVEEFGESGGKWKLKLYGLDSKKEFANKCEPADEMKGDIARIILYVYMHYGYKSQSFPGKVTKSGHDYKFDDMIGALDLTQIMGYDDADRCLEVLKAWNKIDAPSNVEKLRNDSVEKIQGNRNPFVDYPELVDQL